MTTIQAPIMKQTEIATGTWSVVFDLRDRSFAFVSGQYVTITLPQLAHLEVKEQFRDFSIASSPTDLPFLTIAFRTSASAFKETIRTLPVGERVSLEGPKGGIFYSTLNVDADLPAVFIAGGIGITPFRSMIRYIVAQKAVARPTLFYFNHDLASTPFLQELEGYADSIRLKSIFGPVTKETIALDLDEGMVTRARYYIAGPPGMVTTARDILAALGIEDARIHTEEFSGYA